MQITPVIMCGGSGSRLWPLAGAMRPKPLLPLVGGSSTFSETLRRVGDADLYTRPLIVAGRNQHQLFAGACGSGARMLLEPEPRDTAAAIAAAAVAIAASDPDALILVLAADHHIADGEGFRRGIEAARTAAETGAIVVFGVRPTQPATGYGYIARGMALPGEGGLAEVAAFFEKPNAENAARYIAAGYLWNSGNFLMRASVVLEEYARHAPDVLAASTAAIDLAEVAPDGTTVLADVFCEIRISFDHAIMEKTSRAAVIDADFDWSDVGTWEAVWALERKDEQANVAKGDVTIVDGAGNYVTSDRSAIGVIGVDDLIVVESDGNVLITRRSEANSVKALVAAVDGRPEAVLGDFRRHYRPWGHYQTIDLGPTHQVKRLVVHPGKRLSLQKHRHRSEHWTVVEGSAEVTLDDRQVILEQDQSIYIPLGAIHRVSNLNECMLVLIEVQCGSYLGEDDIIRIEDDFGRVVPKLPAMA